MRHALFVFLALCFDIFGCPVAYAGCMNQCTDGAIPCERLGDYLSQSQLSTGEKEWSAYKGYFFVVSSNTLRVSIRFDSEAIGIIRSRSSFALELDVVDNDNILGGDSWSYAHNFPSGVMVRKDVAFMDSTEQLSLLILHPQLLQEEREYIVEFYLDKSITQQGRLHLNMSLSVDFVSSLNPVCLNVGYKPLDKESGWNYFTVEIDPFATFQYSPGSTAGICWTGHDASGFQFCSEINAPYCPTDPVINMCTGAPSLPEDQSAPSPITGGKHEGDLPDLIVHELYLVKEADRDSPHLTQIHIGERSYCNIQVKNIGEAGAWGTWANRCYLSKGNYRDPDPDNLGHESMEDLAAGQSRRVYQIIPPFEYPGAFNITACGDTDGSSEDKAITEYDEGNNCHDEYRITVVSDPNLATTAISLEGIVGNPLTNESFSISSTTANLGENFGPDYVYIGYFIDGNYVGRNQIRRENMQGGMSKAESLFVPGGIATAGVHEVKACADFTGDIAETDETNDCMTLLVNVTDPVNPTPDPEPTQPSPMSQSDDDELFLMLLLD